MTKSHDRPGAGSGRRSRATANTQSPAVATPKGATWKAIVERFQSACPWRATWQVATTLGAYFGVWVLLYLSMYVSWWLTLPLVVLAGGLLVRVFIIFHDCGHGSFFPSRLANDLLGGITGVLTWTPYRAWRAEHAVHHGATGDLDRRGIGDVWTMTVQEYLESSRWRRFAYRVARNPLVLFVFAPFILFVALQRLPKPSHAPRERHSVWGTNLALLVMVLGVGAVFGVVQFLVLQLTVIAIAGAIGVWLFYLQHQFEDAYWERGESWDYEAAAMQGSSFLKLPRVLQWFSGNIGFHHIHHLSPRIPNYRLEPCHQSDPMFGRVQPMTFWSSFKSMRLRLWDEASRKLVGFAHVRGLRRAAGSAIVSGAKGL